MNKAKARLRQARGFTLAETLVTILILLLVTSIVIAGMPTATNVLKKTVDAANAQTLLASTLTRLREELTTALEIKASGSEIIYLSEKGFWSAITPTVPAGKRPGLYLYQVTQYMNPDTVDSAMVVSSAGFNDLLVNPVKSDKTFEGNVLYTAFDNGGFTYDKKSNTVSIKNLVVKLGKGESGDRVIAALPEYTVKVITYLTDQKPKDGSGDTPSTP